MAIENFILMKKLVVIYFFVYLFFHAISGSAQNTARENDSIFEVLAKSIVTKMNSDPSSAIPDAEAFVIFSDTNNFIYRKAAAYQSRQILAALYGRTGQFEKAVALHKTCLRLSIAYNNDGYTAAGYFNLAVAFYREGHQLKGQQYLDTAMFYYQKTENINGLLKGYSMQMAIMADREDFSSILIYSDKALKIVDTIKPKQKMHEDYLNELRAGFYISRSKAFMYMNQDQEAIAQLNKALDFAEKSHLTQMTLTASYNLAKMYLKQEKWKNFDILIRKSIKLAEEKNAQMNILQLKELQAEKESKTGNTTLALQLLQSIEEEVNQLTDIDLKASFNHTMSEVMMRKEDYRAAMKYNHAFDSLTELMIAKENNRIGEELSQKFKLSEKDLTINILTKNQELQQQLILEKERSRRNYMFLSTALILVVLLIAFLLIKIIQKNKALEKLNYFQKNVFTVLSHDIRNYSSAIQISPDVTLKLLERNDLTQAKVLLNDMREKLQSLHLSLSNILLWAAPQMKENILNKTATLQLPLQLELMIEPYQSIAESNSIKIQLLHPVALSLLQHKSAFDVIVRNSLSNAIKHSKANTITFDYTLKNNFLHLVITDNGIGLKDEFIERLNSTTAKKTQPQGIEGGFGLWLISFYAQLAKVTISYSKHEKLNTFEYIFPIKHTAQIS